MLEDPYYINHGSKPVLIDDPDKDIQFIWSFIPPAYDPSRKEATPILTEPSPELVEALQNFKAKNPENNIYYRRAAIKRLGRTKIREAYDFPSISIWDFITVIHEPGRRLLLLPLIFFPASVIVPLSITYTIAAYTLLFYGLVKLYIPAWRAFRELLKEPL